VRDVAFSCVCHKVREQRDVTSAVFVAVDARELAQRGTAASMPRRVTQSG
jgi:hypothetical protein